jgi:hypothetical protein
LHEALWEYGSYLGCEINEPTKFSQRVNWI